MNINKTYNPAPLDTTGVELPPELEELAEELARNVHEVWARNRIDDGWTYGAERDDTTRRHPCLVPYDELPDREKDYDRATSRETIRMILSLGFKITR